MNRFFGFYAAVWAVGGCYLAYTGRPVAGVMAIGVSLFCYAVMIAANGRRNG